MTAPLVPSAIFDQHIAVLGKTRSGKSSVLKKFVELLLKHGKPVCVVDPKGDWWGLKLARDGKSPGFPVVIFGGTHADVPINEHSGAHVAELFATGNRPMLIDLGGWMPEPRTRFWIDFASTLFRLTTGTRHLVIDEVHNFCPKGKVWSPEAGKMVHWTNRLASEGLGRGLPMMIASQRPQKVHNDTLTSCETLIAMRVIHPADRNAVGDWIQEQGDGSGSEVLKTIATMERGEGWIWSPENKLGPLRKKFPLFETYDSFRPQNPEDAGRLTGWPEIDLDEVRAKLATVVEEAKRNDPKELRREIDSLYQQLDEARTLAGARIHGTEQTLRQQEAQEREREVLRTVVTQVAHAVTTMRDSLHTMAEGVAKQLGTFRDDTVQKVESLHTAVDGLHKYLGIQDNNRRVLGALDEMDSTAAALTSPRLGQRIRRALKTDPVPMNGHLSGSQHKIVAMLIMLHRRGLTPNREMLARWLGIHPNGNRYKSDLSYLRQIGHLQEWMPIATGVPNPHFFDTGWGDMIKLLPDGTKQTIMKTLRVHDGQTRESLAALLGIHPNGNRYKSDLSWLRTMGVITERGPISVTEAAGR